jgi:octaprenyl-diphosphate synthase
LKAAVTTPELDEAVATIEPAVEERRGTAGRGIAGRGSAGRGTAGTPSPSELLRRLGRLSAERGRPRLADGLADLADFVAQDMARFDREVASLDFAETASGPRRVGRSNHHLLDLGGKRLRPICVALAARLGSGFSPAVLDLAVAVELVHSATLLHDDVVDMADTRRGAPTARALFGNAASIFAGDWLLIEALRRVERCHIPGLLVTLFDTVEEMILAESLQLENRGRIHTGRDVYFRVVEGKTASVFRWAMDAGAAAGGLGPGERSVLAEYGLHVGIAFQAIDDLLDLTGEAARTGKDLFTDLREGKMTYPVIVALEREPGLAAVVEDILAQPVDAAVPEAAVAEVVAALRRTAAVEDCLALARDSSRRAVAELAALPESRARRALATVAEAIVDRDL